SLSSPSAPSSDSYPLSLHDALPISRESLIRLRELARRAGVPIEPPTLLDGDGAPRFRESPLLGDLERLWAVGRRPQAHGRSAERDRKSTRLNSSHVKISYAVFCLKK